MPRRPRWSVCSVLFRSFALERFDRALTPGLAGLQVIMDEVGRGTATHDGTAIAWAALAHLHNVNRARTLFATHYHEVAERSEALPAAACQQTRIHFGEQVGHGALHLLTWTIRAGQRF